MGVGVVFGVGRAVGGLAGDGGCLAGCVAGILIRAVVEGMNRSSLAGVGNSLTGLDFTVPKLIVVVPRNSPLVIRPKSHQAKPL